MECILAIMMTQKGALKHSRWGWELKTIGPGRSVHTGLSSRIPPQLGRADLGSGPESGTLLLKSLLVVGESEEGHRALQVSRW